MAAGLCCMLWSVCKMCDAWDAGMGYRGAALATAVAYWLQFLTLLFFILFLKVHIPVTLLAQPSSP